jgi:hypothetical protein
MNFSTSAILQIVTTFSPRGKYGAIIAMVLGLWLGAGLSVVNAQCPSTSWSLSLNDTTISCGDGIALGVSLPGVSGNGYLVRWGDQQITLSSTGLAGTPQIPHTYTRPGLYTIELVRKFNSPSCRDSATIQLTVTSTLANPIVSASAACDNQAFTLTATNHTAGDSVFWYQGASSTPIQASLNPSLIKALGTGTYDFKVQYKQGQCLSDIISQSITVYPIPVTPTFTFTNNNACGPATVGFAVTSPVAGISYIFRVGHNNQEV